MAGLFSNFRNKIGRYLLRKGVFGSQIFFHSLGDASVFGDNYRVAAEQGYKRNVYVYSCINLIAKSMAGIPWILQDKISGKEIDQHPILTLLEHPNPMMGGAEFTIWVISYFGIDGNSYIRSIGPDTGMNANQPLELWPVRPDLITPVAGDPKRDEPPIKFFKFESKPGTPPIPLPPEEILHLRTFNPLDPIKGLSPLRAASLSIAQGNESKNWNVSLLRNQARPPGAFVVEGNLEEPQRIEYEASIKRKYQGEENAGTPLLLEGGMKWESFGINPTDMDWLEGQKLSAREIAIIYGVPPELIGDSSNKTYSNYREARRAFYEETVLPTMVWLRDEYNAWLVPKFERGGRKLFLDFDTDDVSALQEDREKLFDRLNKATFLTINQKLKIAGFEPDPNGDVILVPINMVPLGTGMSGHLDNEKPKRPKKDAKAFNITDKSDKLLYWKTFDRRRFRFLDRVESLFTRRLNKDLDVAASAVRSETNTFSLNLIVSTELKEQFTKWKELFEAVYMAVGDDFASDVFSQVKGQVEAPEAKINDFPEESFRDVWQDEIRAWVQANSTTRILGIIDTSIRDVQRAIELGIEGGESIPQIAKRLIGLKNITTPARAKLIARTETISASNLGSHAAAKAVQLPLQKEWVATPDERTRIPHIEADGQTVDGMDEAFSVDGESLLFPGDTSLGATGMNIFNCRCTVIYHVMDSEENIEG